MKKRLLTILIACVFLFGFTFNPGGFTHTTNPSETPDITGGAATTVITVNSTAKLFAEGQDADENGADGETAARKVLQLTQDLTLHEDMTLTGDIAIDLGARSLNLNGHTLTVRHNYAGSFVLANGMLDAQGEAESAGKLLLITPRADAVLTTAVGAAAALSGESVTRANATDARVANLAYSYAADYIGTHGVVGAYSGSISLPTRFGSLGAIEYSSSDSSVLDGLGKVTAGAATNTEVALTPTFIPTGGAPLAAGAAIGVRIIGAANAGAWSIWLNEKLIAPALAATGGKADITRDTFLPVNGAFAGEITYTLGSKTLTAETASVGKFVRVALSDVKGSANQTAALKVVYGGIETVYTLKATDSESQTDPVGTIIRKLFGIQSITQLEFVKVAGNASGFTEYPMILTSELSGLGLSKIESRLNFNLNGSYRIATGDNITNYGTVGIARTPQYDDSVTLTLTLTVSGKAHERTLALLYTDTSSSDTEADPTRFQSHYSAFDQQFRSATHARYELDGTVEIDAMRRGAIPYVAFRVLNADKSTPFAPAAADGGIDLTFVTNAGGVEAEYIPVYGANGIFNGFRQGNTTLNLADSMSLFNANAKWRLSIDVETRNHKLGAVDTELFLEYQYSFATDFSDTAKTYWFVHTDDANRLVKVGSDFTLLSLILSGADTAKYDFGNASVDMAMYGAVRDLVAEGYNFIPYKYISAPRNEVNVKALLYPDVNLADDIPNSDIGSDGREQNSAAGKGFSHWNWLTLLTGTKSLNLHGMGMTDTIVESVLTKLTWLTGLDISGVYQYSYATSIISGTSATGYNEDNKFLAANDSYYSAWTSNVTSAKLLNLFSELQKLETINIAYCKIDTFASLAYLAESIKTVHLEGNLTCGGSGVSTSLGSYGKSNELLVGCMAARADVYQKALSQTIAAKNDSALANWNIVRAMVYQKKLDGISASASDSAISAYLTANVIPSLPKYSMNDIQSVNLSTNYNAGKAVTYTVKGRQIWATVKLGNYERVYDIFVLRLNFEFLG